jgi:hypothetical protein
LVAVALVAVILVCLAGIGYAVMRIREGAKSGGPLTPPAASSGETSEGPTPPAASSDAPVAPVVTPPPASSLCPEGYWSMPANDFNMCSWLGHKGRLVPYEVNSRPSPGHSIVCDGAPMFDPDRKEANISNLRCEICVPNAIPQNGPVPFSVMYPLMWGKSADRASPASWAGRWPECSTRVNPECAPKCNGDGSFDYRGCFGLFDPPDPTTSK